jgi:hypothetical protein
VRKSGSILGLGLLVGLVAVLVAVPAASASYGPTAEYQVALSSNCNNATACGDSLGGDWGWGVFNNDGTGELQITFCGHTRGQGGGAGHEDVDIYAWHIAGGVFVIDSASDPSFEGPSPIPGMPGHYSFHPAPGVATEVNVAQIPNR